MSVSFRMQLSAMMFLQYFIWGAWYVTMGTYMAENLGASGVNIGMAYSALAVATIISPFFVGMIADRFFAAQRIMGLLHIVGAGLLFLATQMPDSTSFYWVILMYSLVYMPTIALSNSVAFYHMTDPGKQFPWIRVFGTLGWIVAGLLITLLGIEKSSGTFLMAALLSGALGIFSLTLPNVPPKGSEDGSSALSTEAFVMFKDKPYLIFFIAAILVCIPLSFYYGFANLFLNDVGMADPASKMTLGQVSEAIFILALPFLFYRWGVKNILLVGMLAWILRYIFFAFGDADANLWMLYTGIILHGICYDFFFITGYMYTEVKAGEKIKNAAQGLFTVATYGVGMVIGTWFSGLTVEHYTDNGVYGWMNIWFVPAAIAIAVLIYFILFFHEKKEIKPAS